MKDIIDRAIAAAKADGLIVWPTDEDEPDDTACCCLVGALSHAHGTGHRWPQYRGKEESIVAERIGVHPKALEALARGFDDAYLPDDLSEYSEAFQLGVRYRKEIL